MRYLRARKKAVAGALLVLGIAAIGALVVVGALTWSAALQLSVLGAIGVGTAANMLLVRRLDLRTKDVHRIVHGGDPPMSTAQMNRIANHAKEARRRAETLHAEGRIQEAVDELVPYAVLDDAADQARRRMLSERRALGPVIDLPERRAATLPPFRDGSCTW